LEAYNKHFNQKYTIPTYDKFRKEVSLRLGHKKPFDSIGKDEQIDILIVVNQMLTGFDSKFVNTLYLDKMMEYENLIQAFSRTNRLYNMAEKPFGIIKYYRRPNTMEKNIEAAVKAYSGDVPTGLFVDKLPNNLRNMNVLFQSIEQIFKNAGIVNFEKLPADNAAIGKFAKEFNKFVNHLEAAIIQGFTWSKNSYPDEDQNEDAIKMLIDEQTYLTLLARYKEITRGGGGGASGDVPYEIDVHITEWIVSEQVNQEKAEVKGKKSSKAAFLRWFAPLIQALRDLGGSGTPAEARAKIIENEQLSEDEINETRGRNNVNKFENEVAFARNYLVNAGYIDKSVNITVRQSRQSGVARATCPD